MRAALDSDPRRVLMIGAEALFGRYYLEPGRYSAGIEISPTIRFNNRLSTEATFEWEIDNNDEGFAGITDGSIIFGQRDNRTMSFEFDFSYMFSDRSYLSVRLREYWARAEYTGSYFILEDDGSLTQAPVSRNDNTSYNAFNADINYTWRFAPGSELTLVFKNSLYMILPERSRLPLEKTWGS
jgi:hypothetical protein